MTNSATLSINIQSYWHAGTGRGSSHYLDALCHTDANGLPNMPGKTLKGLLRDALNRRESWGHSEVPRGTTTQLFGSIGVVNKQIRRETTPGALTITNATLPDEVIAWLTTSASEAHKKALFTELYSTAIESTSGTAKTNSLRGLQASIPLTLSATLSYIGDDKTLEKSWQKIIKTSLPLIRAVGSNRSRGLGRATLILEAKK